MKARLSFYYDHNIKFPNRITDFIFNVNQYNVNMSFPSSNFEGNFRTYVFGKSF